jgi:hypothetical protein
LDFYHLSENVHKARRTVFGADAAAGNTWAAELLHALKHEGYDAAWQRCVAWRAALRGAAKRKAADRLLNYMAERRDMIQYPEFAARGWQIGSGPTALALQDQHVPPQRPRPPLERSQRRSRRRPNHPQRQQPMEPLLANPLPNRHLSPPRRIAAPDNDEKSFRARRGRADCRK